MTKRYLAEWEIEGRILLAFPHPQSDWFYILNEAREQFKRIITILLEHGEKILLLIHPEDIEGLKWAEMIEDTNMKIFIIPFNDTWTRDYGPITVEIEGSIKCLDFGFNGWGLKFASDQDNLATLRLFRKPSMILNSYLNRRGFILEGGSIETDGQGTLLTTEQCLLSPNRNPEYTRQGIEAFLKKELGIKEILWLKRGALEGDDTDSHIDTLCRLAPNNTILFTECKDAADTHFEELKKMALELLQFRTPEGDPYSLVPLPLPKSIYSPEGERIPGTYANYLVTPRNVFVPTYNQPENDYSAMRSLKKVFPDKKIVGVNCLTLLRQHGSLHCSTMTIPEEAFASTQ